MPRPLSLATFAAALAAAISVHGSALAEPAHIKLVEVAVSSRGLDLSTEAGSATFLRRISRAAAKACGNYPYLSPLLTGQRQAFDACKAEAMSRAMAEVQSPSVRRAYASRMQNLGPLARR